MTSIFSLPALCSLMVRQVPIGLCRISSTLICRRSVIRRLLLMPIVNNRSSRKEVLLRIFLISIMCWMLRIGSTIIDEPFVGWLWLFDILSLLTTVPSYLRRPTHYRANLLLTSCFIEAGFALIFRPKPAPSSLKEISLGGELIIYLSLNVKPLFMSIMT